MNADNLKDLSKIRLERSKELLADAEELLNHDSYKSANNRAFYAAEKAIKSVLSAIGKDSDSHVGVVRTFNIEFIHNPSDFFNREDLRIIQSMDRIRNASDYDDFYIADKSECAEQVKNAKYLIDKVEIFLKNNGIL